MKRIAFIGASGYGNIGDDMYPIVLREYLQKENQLSFFNSDLPQEAPEADLYVFGGGGLIWNEKGSAHLEYMRQYAKWAKKKDIPYMFVSCGIQPRHNYKGHSKWALWPLQEWKDILCEAVDITVRSPTGAKLLSRIIRKEVDWYPDIGYLYKPEVSPCEEQNGYTVWTPVASARASSPWAQRVLSRMKEDRLKILNMGGPQTEYLVQEAASCYPMATVKTGLSITPQKAYSIIANSSMVIAGRYHSLIFARTSGVGKILTNPHAQFKIESEPNVVDFSTAVNHIAKIKKVIG
jgi:hypothetical protein